MKLEREWLIKPDNLRAIDLLVESGISKAKLKDAMAKGAVELVRGRKHSRLRRVTIELQVGDSLRLHYDAELLARPAPQPLLLQDFQAYSVWYKPAGLLAQGNEWGDHCALLRLVELHFASKRPALLVHRLDREASGLMVVAHTSTMAAKLSALFTTHAIEKNYQVAVRGELPSAGRIEAELDGKTAVTHYQRHAFSEHEENCEAGVSLASITIDTGRKHQIRRHLELIGHPVLGDPQYGRGNSDERGLQLVAVRLAFQCPLRQHAREIILPEQYCLF